MDFDDKKSLDENLALFADAVKAIDADCAKIRPATQRGKGPSA
jgi:hypothetical protein